MQTLNRNQAQRLTVLEACLENYGYITRSVLEKACGVGMAQVTKDIGVYRMMAAKNMRFCNSSKRWQKTQDFEPIFYIADDEKIAPELG